jgi:hypothetical protein
MRGVFILFLFMGISMLNSCSAVGKEQQFCDEIMNRVGSRMRETNGMILEGKGVRIPNKIHGIDPTFVVYGEHTIEQGRVLIVNCVEEILAQVNCQETAKPLMKEYPFTNRNAEIIIGFRGAKTGEFYAPYLFTVLNVNNTIFYSTIDRETGLTKLLYSEPYEEGLRIVREGCK